MQKIFACVFLILFVSTSCQQDDYDIDYQDGNPSELAGNWIAYEFQGGALDMDRLNEEYDLVTALDPNSKDSLIIDNLYNSGVRVKAHFEDSVFNVSYGKQLEVINMGQYGIHSVSVTGEFQNSEENGDYLLMNVGLYDQYATLVDTVFVWAFPKTGFEDIDYQSLLSKK